MLHVLVEEEVGVPGIFTVVRVDWSDSSEGKTRSPERRSSCNLQLKVHRVINIEASCCNDFQQVQPNTRQNDAAEVVMEAGRPNPRGEEEEAGNQDNGQGPRNLASKRCPKQRIPPPGLAINSNPNRPACSEDALQVWGRDRPREPPPRIVSRRSRPLDKAACLFGRSSHQGPETSRRDLPEWPRVARIAGLGCVRGWFVLADCRARGSES